MKESAKATWMRRRDGMEEIVDDRLDLLPDEPTRALWSACPNPPPLDMAEANALFRRALEQSGVKPRWWFMPRPIALTFGTCGGVFLAAFLAFGPSNGPSAWLPLIESLTPSRQTNVAFVRPEKPAKKANVQIASAKRAESAKVAAPKRAEMAPTRMAAAPVIQRADSRPLSVTVAAPKPVNTLPKTKPAPARLALAPVAASSPQPFLYVSVSKPEPALTASITHDGTNRGGYAKVTALRPNDNGVLVRTEATVTTAEPEPQVVTHVPSWATGMNGLPAPVSTRPNAIVPAADGGKE